MSVTGEYLRNNAACARALQRPAAAAAGRARGPVNVDGILGLTGGEAHVIRNARRRRDRR